MIYLLDNYNWEKLWIYTNGFGNNRLTTLPGAVFLCLRQQMVSLIFSNCNNRRMTFAHAWILLSFMQRIDKTLVALKDFDLFLFLGIHKWPITSKGKWGHLDKMNFSFMIWFFLPFAFENKHRFKNFYALTMEGIDICIHPTMPWVGSPNLQCPRVIWSYSIIIREAWKYFWNDMASSSYISLLSLYSADFVKSFSNPCS